MQSISHYLYTRYISFEVNSLYLSCIERTNADKRDSDRQSHLNAARLYFLVTDGTCLQITIHIHRLICLINITILSYANNVKINI